MTERVENVLGHGQWGSILVHVGTNNADRDGTTRIVKRYRELVETLKKTRDHTLRNLASDEGKGNNI